jgi:patatin-like phospholipase/acyl hydrolase
MSRAMGKLRHVRSLDNLMRRTFRPGSKLEEDPMSDGETTPTGRSAGHTGRPFRILSIDGGGVKGMFSLRILERLMAKFPRLIDDVDLIAGTSTGGLVAIMLAHGYSPAQGLEIYRHNIPIIFNTNIFRRLAPFLATYSNRHRQEVFDHYLGGVKLGDLGKHIVITAFRLDGGPDKKGNATFFPSGSWRPALMSNLPLASGLVPPDNDLECTAAAMRTTSAPTYFPIHQVESRRVVDCCCFLLLQKGIR